MDEDYGTQYADRQAQNDWADENDVCPDCEARYDINGHCECLETLGGGSHEL